MLRKGTVRTRTVAGAVVVVGVALILASIVMILFLRSSLTDDVRIGAFQEARRVADQIEDGIRVERIPVSNDDDEFLQVLGPDGLVRASENMEDGGPVIRMPPGKSVSIEVPFDDDPFLAVAVGANAPAGTFTVVVGRTLDNVVESSAAVLRLLSVGVPILMVLVGLITWRVTGRALAPVEAIRSEVEAITSEVLHRRVPVSASKDEIARLAATMNGMLDRLEQGQARERRFVSDASHELRSPVATIRQHLEVALAHHDSTSVRELAQQVLVENIRLQRLVEDLLLLARTDEDPAERRIAVDLDDVVFVEVERLKDVTTKTVDLSEVSAGRVLGDERRLSSLVRNLLENAVRHATALICVSLKEIGDNTVLTVDDDGPGIPEAERERVFERFVRLDDARDRDSGGSGLGLAIVAEVAALLGGRARVVDAPAGGARFEIRLPRG